MWADGSELVGDDLGGHVFGGALEQAAIVAGNAAGDAKIAQLDAIRFVEHQIAGLDVTVNDAVLMQEVQRVQRVDQRESQKVDVDRLAVQLLLQAALHQLQNEPASLADDVVDRHDVGMFERGQQLGLLPIAFQLCRVVEILLMDLLDRHLAIELQIAGTIDRSEIALGDLVDNLISLVGLHG